MAICNSSENKKRMIPDIERIIRLKALFDWIFE